MSYTLTFENLNEQDILDYEKNHNVNFKEFIENLIKPKTKGVKHYSQSEIELAKEKLNEQFGEFAHLAKFDESVKTELQKIRDFSKKYAHLNPHKKPVSIEEMDRIAREAFAKKWEQDELLNKSAE